MNKHIRTKAEQPPHDARPKHPQHPSGLLYTLLRHGRGLSHEEAVRRAAAAIAAAPPKAA